jgi:hypothetical protein
LSLSSTGQGKNLQYPFNMLDGPQSQLRGYGEVKNLCPSQKIEPDCLAVQPENVIELCWLSLNNRN